MKNFLINGVIFLSCLLILSIFFPFLAYAGHNFIPIPFQIILHYWNNACFPYEYLFVASDSEKKRIFSEGIALLLNFLQWILFASVYAFFMRHVKSKLVVIIISLIILSILPIVLAYSFMGMGFKIAVE